MPEEEERYQEEEKSENAPQEKERQENKLTEEATSNIDLSRRKEELPKSNKTVKNRLPDEETSAAAGAAEWSSMELKDDYPRMTKRKS